MVFIYDGWKLYKMEVTLKGDLKRYNYFFSKRNHPKKEWIPIDKIPDGYEIYQTELGSKMPVLRKK